MFVTKMCFGQNKKANIKIQGQIIFCNTSGITFMDNYIWQFLIFTGAGECLSIFKKRYVNNFGQKI